MPPKGKKPVAGPGPKRTPKSTKAAPKPAAQNPPEIAEVKEEVKIVEESNPNNNKNEEAPKIDANNSNVSVKNEDEVKEDDIEKGERLDLEDNEPDYEPEEYGGDYDEKEVDQDVQEEGEEIVEEIEEGDVGEEGDMGEEEAEDVPEEFDGEEDDEQAEDNEQEQEQEQEQEHEHEHGQADLIDAAEEQEHHDVVKERRKRKEFEIFVGGLDKDATEEDLREVFSTVGEITEVRLMMNPQTKKNKGFAFLRFATVEQAKRAVAELKNPVVKGKQCGVTPSQDSDTLFVGNICKTWTKEKLIEKLKLYGIENIDDLTLVEDSNNDGKNRGFAFLEFYSRSDAMDAFKRLQKRDVLLGVDRPAKVSFADSFIDPGDEVMSQVKTVFIDGLPPSWDEDRVKELLKQYGTIEKVELARNMSSARRKDFGFVIFDSHDAAVTCAKGINNSELGVGESKAKVRARLARPGKSKHKARGEGKGGRPAGRRFRAPWNRPFARALPPRSVRGMAGRAPAFADRSMKRPIALRGRRAAVAAPPRARPLPPPPRPYDRRAPVPAPPKSSLRKNYPRREEFPPRSRAAADYGSRMAAERRASYRDEYAAPAYSDLHRGTASRSSARRPYGDDPYGPRYERPPPSYREGRGRDYDSVPGSKRSYSAMDDIPPRYADPGVRHSRARVDYDVAGGASHYGDSYSDRLGRSSLGYGSSRSSMSSQDPLYSSRHGAGYSGGSYGSSDAGGVYSSSYSGDYASRGSDVGGSSYSSLYSGRGLGGSSYMGSGGSSSYY